MKNMLLKEEVESSRDVNETTTLRGRDPRGWGRGQDPQCRGQGQVHEEAEVWKTEKFVMGH